MRRATLTRRWRETALKRSLREAGSLRRLRNSAPSCNGGRQRRDDATMIGRLEQVLGAFRDPASHPLRKGGGVRRPWCVERHWRFRRTPGGFDGPWGVERDARCVMRVIAGPEACDACSLAVSPIARPSRHPSRGWAVFEGVTNGRAGGCLDLIEEDVASDGPIVAAPGHDAGPGQAAPKMSACDGASPSRSGDPARNKPRK
jgi:hypothetical protein